MKGRVMAFCALICISVAPCARSNDELTLPDMGAAPGFHLISLEGSEVELASLRGKVVVVAFIYTWCPDICPLLTMKMAQIQDALGDTFGRDVAFVSITFDPERDTPKVLRAYAEAFGADPDGWHFLTGDKSRLHEVASAYGVLTYPGADGAIDHNMLTSLIDRQGRMRVQYAGYRFDPAEMLADLRTLIADR